MKNYTLNLSIFVTIFCAALISPLNVSAASNSSADKAVVTKTNLAMRIVFPRPGVVFDQGQTANIQIASVNGAIPKKIVIIALDNTYIDHSPKPNNVYDINVPMDQKPGSYMVNFIVEWPNNEISSNALTFYVKDATPLGLF